MIDVDAILREREMWNGRHQEACLELEKQQKDLELYREALIDIRELVDGQADVDDGMPNLAMKVLVLVKLGLREP